MNKDNIKLTADEEKYLQHLECFRITSQTKIPEESYVFKVQGVGCMPLGDLAAVKAEPKKGKTTTLKRIIATALMGELGQLTSDLRHPLIIWVDTEQKMGDAKCIITDIKKMTGLTDKYLDKHLMVYSLRKTDCKTMLEEVKTAVKGYQPQIVVIDGIAEFVESVNDEVYAKNLIQQLMIVCESYHCCIICVLHMNRGPNREMKGHLGANLTQKAAVVVECTKNGDVITVKCSDTRHQSTPSWSIKFDEQGNIVDANDSLFPLKVNSRPSDKPNKKQLDNMLEKQKRQDFCLCTIKEHGGRLPRKELVALLEQEFGLNRSRATGLISEFIKNDGILYETNKMISATPQGTEVA